MAMRQHGLSCDSILGAEVVLANGTQVSPTMLHPTTRFPNRMSYESDSGRTYCRLKIR